MRISVDTFGRPSLLLGFDALLVTATTNASVAQAPASPTEAQTVQANLPTFDDLDFNVFSNQKWDQLPRSHAKDILVHWPDGHTTKGIEKHIEDLKAMFVYAPDTRIKVHPVKFGSGEWTSVIGEMEGTFTKPMPEGGGKTIAPTGKAFKLPMCTVGRWKNGVMVEEYLFWDNQTYMKQLGL
jgi:hypothetical protein